MSGLPTGTVTLFFTDIAGSTELWQDFPDAMPAILARHDVLLREAIARHGGYVVKTIGDAFMAVFPTAPEGVNAALAAQRALCKEPWHAHMAVCVRMGLHAGATEERDGDYYGHEVNRAARIQGVAHPQQIVLSQAAVDLVSAQLPQGAALQDLGLHRLKDLREPERLWQLCHSDLPSAFPPLNSLSHLPNNLPAQMTSFVGREKESAEVKTLLARSRCLTLLGLGGTGKTRLALQVAADTLPEYSHGVWLAELAPLSDAGLIPQTLATMLGLREEPGKTLTQTLTDYFKPRTLLLILDNCEHLLDACARLADTLLEACPDLKLLATSRERLAIAGEQPWRVPALSIGGEGGAPSDAMILFAERARVQRSDFALTPQNAPVIAKLCRQLDGIPLALELRAARVRALSVEQIVQRLDDRFKLLTGGDRMGLPHHLTLRATMDWSYDLLSEAEKTLLTRLSIFAGGWTLEACEQVVVGKEIEEWEVLDLLTALVDKSLVVAEEREDHVRYRLLETLRQYAGEKREESDAYRRRHRDYFLRLAEEAKQKGSGPNQVMTFQMLEIEHDNLRAALDFCREDPQSREEGLRLVIALQRFWIIRGYLSEGRERHIHALMHPKASELKKLRADALNGGGSLAWHQADFANAHSLYEESLTIRRELGDKRGIASSLNNLGLVARSQGDFASARAMYEESLALSREIADKQGIASPLNNLGIILQEQGEYAAARLLNEESLAIRRELGDKHGIATSLNNLGIVAHIQGEYALARAMYEESLATRRELGDKQGIASSLGNLGIVASRLGEYDRARALYEEGLAIRQDMGDRHGIAIALNNLGNVAGHEGHRALSFKLQKESLTLHRELGDRVGMVSTLSSLATLAREARDSDRAIRLFAATQALRDVFGAPIAPIDRKQLEQTLDELRKDLGGAAYDSCWQAGYTLPLEEVIELALHAEMGG